MIENVATRTPFFAGYLQFDVRSGAIEQNLASAQKGLEQIVAASPWVSPGIIVLPELWATGFDYEKLPELTKRIPAVLKDLLRLAAKYGLYLAGSLPEHANDSYYNTLFITGPAGLVGFYRKQRLFSPMAEDTFFMPGTMQPQPLQTDVGSIAALVCYDLRFPELLRAQTALGSDLLLISAQWPAARIAHWRILIQARAIENQMFIVAANRCGTTDSTTFGGHSMIVGPDGSILLEAGEDEDCRGTVIAPEMLASARSVFCTLPK
jgi:predicted amidohydrolase